MTGSAVNTDNDSSDGGGFRHPRTSAWTDRGEADLQANTFQKNTRAPRKQNALPAENRVL